MGLLHDLFHFRYKLDTLRRKNLEVMSELVDTRHKLDAASSANLTLIAEEERLKESIEAFEFSKRLMDVKDSHRKSRDERIEKVELALTNELCPLHDRPYVKGGLFYWKYIDYPVALDFMFPDVPFAVCISSSYLPFDIISQSTDITRGFWEEDVAKMSGTADACFRAGIPLLIIGPNDPVDPHSISLIVRSTIEKFKV